MNKDRAFQKKMNKEKKQLLDAFNSEYLAGIPLTDYEWYGSQTGTVMALQFGMVAEEKIEAVIKGLEHNIEAVKGVHHATGIHGNRYIYTVLNEYGKAYDLARASILLGRNERTIQFFKPSHAKWFCSLFL